MCTTNTQCLDFKGLELDKYKQFQSKKETIFLWFNAFVTSMVSYATGVLQKSICRNKRGLESQGLPFKDEKQFCKPKGFKLGIYLQTHLPPKSNLKKV